MKTFGISTISSKEETTFGWKPGGRSSMKPMSQVWKKLGLRSSRSHSSLSISAILRKVIGWPLALREGIPKKISIWKLDSTIHSKLNSKLSLLFIRRNGLSFKSIFWKKLGNLSLGLRLQRWWWMKGWLIFVTWSNLLLLLRIRLRRMYPKRVADRKSIENLSINSLQNATQQLNP